MNYEPLIVVLRLLGSAWLYTVVFYVLFLAYSAYDMATRAGRSIPRVVLWIIAPVFICAAIIDIAYNVVVGSILYLEWPWAIHPNNWTFTERCRFHKDDKDYRGALARWFASILNPFDQNHI